MESVRRAIRTIVVAALGAAIAVVVAGRTTELVPTNVGSAAVVLDIDTARVVEQVAYRQDVDRLGDVVVVGGQPSQPITDPVVAEVWAVVDAVWPERWRPTLAQVSVIDEGWRGLVGVVHRSSVPSAWVLSLDAADLEDRVLVEETIVHELAHVVTLDSSVFTFGSGDCDGARIDIGCAAQGSLVDRFAARFWSDAPSHATSLDASHAHFVTDYAATAVHEDIAETFTAWVYLDEEEVSDVATTHGDVVAAKIDLLASDREMVELREALRERIMAQRVVSSHPADADIPTAFGETSFDG